MKHIHIPLTLALMSCLISFSATAETPAEIKASCLKGDIIQKSAARDDAVLLQWCLDAGTPIDSADGNGWTPLHAAAFNGKYNIVKLLLERGANRGLKDKNGKTPLDLAAGKQHNEIAATLKTKELTTTDAKTIKMAEALRFEINNYGPTSSDDSVDRQVVEILQIESVKGDPTSGDKAYKIKVKFKFIVEGKDMGNGIYEGLVYEDSSGHITVGEYDEVAS